MTSEDSLTPLSLTCGASNALIGSNHANGIFTGGTCTASAPALLESTQTFSAQTTFTGSVNISSPSALVVSGMATYTSSASFGGSAYSLAANYSSVIKGGWTIVASTNPAGATTFTFTGLNNSLEHRLKFRFLHNTTDGDYILRFNGDSGSNYGYAMRRLDSAANVNSDFAAPAAATFLQLAGTTGLVNATNGVRCELDLGIEPGDATRVHVDPISCGYIGGSGEYFTMRGSGYYDGASALTSVSLTVNAGNFTGLVYLLALVPPVIP